LLIAKLSSLAHDPDLARPTGRGSSRLTYFERYKNGQCVAVWNELTALGETVRDSAIFGDAVSVAHLTMERVATNIDRLVERLASHGYEFGVYPDGTRFPIESAALAKPDAEFRALIAELEHLAGAIPLSLRAFWDVVGSVSLIGRARNDWPEYGDPLCVEGPAAGLADFHDWYADLDMGEPATEEAFLCPIAPDVLHKDNVSGGPPYSVKLPDRGADAMVCDEWHNVCFIPYLRIAILDWGGFPGLSHANPQDRWRSKGKAFVPPEWLPELTHDLMTF
jgi:hypothetical protein